MRGSLSRCTTLSRRRARRPDSRIRRYNFLPAECPVPVSALVIGNTDTFSSGAPPYSGGGDIHALLRPPLPRPCLRQGIPIHLCRRPPPHPRLRRDIRALLPASPTPPAPSLAGYPYTSAGDPHLARAFGKGYSYASAGIPHPSRAFGAPPPPPLGGGVRAWRYQVSSRARGGDGGKPYPALSHLSPCSGPCGYRHGG